MPYSCILHCTILKLGTYLDYLHEHALVHYELLQHVCLNYQTEFCIQVSEIFVQLEHLLLEEHTLLLVVILLNTAAGSLSFLPSSLEAD